MRAPIFESPIPEVSKSKVNVGVIVGAVVGSVVGVAILLVFVLGKVRSL
jgi:hypothetical protein